LARKGGTTHDYLDGFPSAEQLGGGAGARTRAIFWGGLLAGILDITQAFIGLGFLGAKPVRILQHIAGGVFRGPLHPDALDGRRAGPGLSFHHRIYGRSGLLPC